MVVIVDDNDVGFYSLKVEPLCPHLKTGSKQCGERFHDVLIF
jgi:hypothetical protein